MVREIERAGGLHISMPVDRKNPLKLKKNAKRLEAIIQAHGVNLVHARSRAPAWIAKWAARALKIPFVTTFHSTYSTGKGLTKGLKKQYNSVMLDGDRVIAISNFIARHIEETYPESCPVVRTVPRGIDLNLFSPNKVSGGRLEQLSQKWRLPDDAQIVLLPARVVERKGHVTAINALARITRPDVRLVIVGGEKNAGGYRNRLDHLVENLGLASRVQFVGECNDMPAAYRLASVVLAPSIEAEAFGRVPMEALAMGRPIIASNIGAFPETLDGGNMGMLCDAGNSVALANGIAEALAMTPEQRDWFEVNGPNYVRANYSKPGMIKATFSIYDELLAPLRIGEINETRETASA